MAEWKELAALLAPWLVACGRVADSTLETGGAGASAGGQSGTAGAPTVSLVSPSEGGQAGSYPPPFDALSCPHPVPPHLQGVTRCVTRSELSDAQFPNVTLDGGVDALGPADAWRCPRASEVTFAPERCGGEGGPCCESIVCGPLTQRSSIAGAQTTDAGAAGAGGASEGEQTCCYYLLEQCGV
ncbi:MAG TPA: hypothetical protein VFK05_21515 [Polyangiaceae bacterium]|nr:hypothetical protein [Polyangiaceae bacterium]